MQLLHSNIIGEGKPFLILHGFLGMSDNWKTLGKQYATQGYEVHLVDQRNHGKSFHSDDFNYDYLTEDIYNYCQHYKLSNIILLGHSMGGKTAMQVATKYPELVAKLIVADIAPKYYPPHHNIIINALTNLKPELLSSRKEADAKLALEITDFGTRQFLLKNLYWKEKEMLGLRINLDILSNKMEEIGENIAATETYNKPTLFLRGDRSEYISPHDFDTIQLHFPMAKVATIDNAGHWLHAENPKQFYSKSLEFIIS